MNSAFTDQSVRLRSHWFAERLGKFSVAQLAKMQEHLTVEQRSDPYLQILWNEPAQRTRSAVREFWLAKARQALADERYDDSYRGYTLAAGTWGGTHVRLRRNTGRSARERSTRRLSCSREDRRSTFGKLETSIGIL